MMDAFLGLLCGMPFLSFICDSFLLFTKTATTCSTVDAWLTTGDSCSNIAAPAPDRQLVCEFGEECCCGGCSPSYVCYCENGRFLCYYTERCMMATQCGGTDGASGLCVIDSLQCVEGECCPPN
jgi:hypothetical protein